MDRLSSKWTPCNQDNNGIITETYEFIIEKLHYLKAETDCPDEFIYKFIGAIQKEWHPSSCQSIARTSKDFKKQS